MSNKPLHDPFCDCDECCADDWNEHRDDRDEEWPDNVGAGQHADDDDDYWLYGAGAAILGQQQEEAMIDEQREATDRILEKIETMNATWTPEHYTSVSCGDLRLLAEEVRRLRKLEQETAAAAQDTAEPTDGMNYDGVYPNQDGAA